MPAHAIRAPCVYNTCRYVHRSRRLSPTKIAKGGVAGVMKELVLEEAQQILKCALPAKEVIEVPLWRVLCRIYKNELVTHSDCHEVHNSALTLSLNVPVAQSVHARSVLRVGGAATYVPVCISEGQTCAIASIPNHSAQC